MSGLLNSVGPLSQLNNQALVASTQTPSTPNPNAMSILPSGVGQSSFNPFQGQNPFFGRPPTTNNDPRPPIGQPGGSGLSSSPYQGQNPFFGQPQFPLTPGTSFLPVFPQLTGGPFNQLTQLLSGPMFQPVVTPTINPPPFTPAKTLTGTFQPPVQSPGIGQPTQNPLLTVPSPGIGQPTQNPLPIIPLTATPVGGTVNLNGPVLNPNQQPSLLQRQMQFGSGGFPVSGSAFRGNPLIRRF